MNRTSSQLILYLFAKAPVPGAVKTRMQPRLSAESCAELAASMCRHICATLDQHWAGAVVIKAAPDASHPLFHALAEQYGFEREAQSGSDLGQRMLEALDRGIHRCGCAAVIGADVPHISPDIVAEAVKRMLHGQNVIGPASDGGFYFLGLQHSAPTLFQDIAWGGEQVLQRVSLRARELSIDLSCLPELRDIDRFEDLQWLAHRHPDYNRFVSSNSNVAMGRNV